MADSNSTKPGSLLDYELIYWPTIPGRGEFIRLALEAAGAAYKDPSNESKDGINGVLSLIAPDTLADEAGNPPIFAPPALRIRGVGKDGKSLLISQTPNILLYLGSKLGLLPDDEGDRLHAQQVLLTALDLCNEAHDTHHPLASSKYYSDQQKEALKKAQDFRDARMPKFFDYFERVLKSNNEGRKGRHFVGDKLTIADTTVWQVLDGLFFAFPKAMDAFMMSDPVKYKLLLGTFYPTIKEERGIKEYLASERRNPYSDGIFRHYPELDKP